MFKTIVRTFSDQKVGLGRLINRETVLGVLKEEKRNSKLTYAEIARKLAKSEVIWLILIEERVAVENKF